MNLYKFWLLSDVSEKREMKIRFFVSQGDEESVLEPYRRSDKMEDCRDDYVFVTIEKKRQIQRKKFDVFPLLLLRIIFWPNHQVVPIFGWDT